MTLNDSLLSLSRSLHECEDIPSSMEVASRFINEQTRYRSASVLLRTRNGHHIERIGAMLPGGRSTTLRLAAVEVHKDPFMRRMYESPRPYCIPDLREDPQANQANVEYFGNRTLIVVPMLPIGTQVGAMLVPTYKDQGVVEPTQAEMDIILRVAAILTPVFTRIIAQEGARSVHARIRSSERLASLGQLAGEVAHDFNNVLQAVGGNAQLALLEYGDHPAARYVREIQVAAERANNLSRQLLNFSKGQLLAPGPLQIATVFSDLEAMLSRLLPSHVRLEFQASEQLPMLLADRGQLELMLMNLVINARDAMPEGGNILVSARAITLQPETFLAPVLLSAGHYIRISVQDTGTGIPPEVQTRIFDPFFTTKPKEQGTGLGLSMVQNAARELKGDVRFETGASGTTFELYLPVTELAKETERSPTPKPSPTRGRGQEILVAEDQQALRTLLSRFLQRAGYSVHVAEDGKQALQLLREHPGIELVLSDINMPRLGGAALQQAIETMSRPPHLVFMTGADATPEPGAPPILKKPFQFPELLQAISKQFNPPPTS